MMGMRQNTASKSKTMAKMIPPKVLTKPFCLFDDTGPWIIVEVGLWLEMLLGYHCKPLHAFFAKVLFSALANHAKPLILTIQKPAKVCF